MAFSWVIVAVVSLVLATIGYILGEWNDETVLELSLAGARSVISNLVERRKCVCY